MRDQRESDWSLTHKRKERLFRRKKRTCAIVPKEFASIFDYLAEPDQEEVKLVPDASYPEVRVVTQLF